MKKQINFSGISFEVGQSKSGITASTGFARQYFPVLRAAGLDIIDQGDITPQFAPSRIKVFSEIDLSQIHWQKYHQAYLKTLKLLEDSSPLLNWGGDHSIGISTVGAFCHQYPDGYVLWIDAHADLNLPGKSLSGNLHGMPLSVLLNLEGIATANFEWLKSTLNPEKLIYIGLRDLDLFEANVIEALNIKRFFCSEVRNLGMEVIAKEILQITQGHPLHISFDIDSIDPELAPSTGVPVENGMTVSDLEILSRQLFKNSEIRSLDIVEINPDLGTQDEVHQTYSIAFNFLQSVFNHTPQGGTYDCTGQRDQRKQSTDNEWNF